MFRQFLLSLSKKNTHAPIPQVDDEKLEAIITELMSSPERTLEELALLNDAEKQRLAALITIRHTSKTDDINRIDHKLDNNNWAAGIVTKAAITGSANAILSMSPQFFASETEASIERKNELELHRTRLAVILQTVNENIASNTAAKQSPRSSPRRVITKQ